MSRVQDTARADFIRAAITGDLLEVADVVRDLFAAYSMYTVLKGTDLHVGPRHRSRDRQTTQETRNKNHVPAHR
jgi:hypothetical protein